MDLRQATTDDVPGIRRVARRSLSATYDFLDEEVIERAIEQWYDDESFGESIAGEFDVFLVVTVDDEVVAYSQSSILGETDTTGEIRWLHVDPDHRGKGIASDLYDRTVEVLRRQGVERIRGVVLSGNEAGGRFYEDRGLELAAKRTVEIGGEQHEELVYRDDRHDAEGRTADTDRHEVDGVPVFVFRDEGDRGSNGLFHPAYRDTDGKELYTWYCANCGSFDTAVGSMGQIECTQCGNRRKPTRWDAAYL